MNPWIASEEPPKRFEGDLRRGSAPIIKYRAETVGVAREVQDVVLVVQECPPKTVRGGGGKCLDMDCVALFRSLNTLADDAGLGVHRNAVVVDMDGIGGQDKYSDWL